MEKKIIPLPGRKANLEDYAGFLVISSPSFSRRVQHLQTFEDASEQSQGYVVGVMPMGYWHLIQLSDLDIIYIGAGSLYENLDVCPFDGGLSFDDSTDGQETTHLLGRFVTGTDEVCLIPQTSSIRLLRGRKQFLRSGTLMNLEDGDYFLDGADNLVLNAQPGRKSNEWMVKSNGGYSYNLFDSDTGKYLRSVDSKVPASYLYGLKVCGDAYVSGPILCIPFRGMCVEFRLDGEVFDFRWDEGHVHNATAAPGIVTVEKDGEKQTTRHLFNLEGGSINPA